MSKRNSILEGLHEQKIKSVNEEVQMSVRRAVKDFLTKQRAPSGVKNKVNNILNYIWQECNNLGDNTFSGGHNDFTKGELLDYGNAETGPLPDYYPSIYEVNFIIKFHTKTVTPKIAYEALGKLLKSNMKSNYQDFDMDMYAITLGINYEKDEPYGYFVSVEKITDGLKVIVGNQVNPLDENANVHSPMVMQYYKGLNNRNTYRFEFQKADECVKITVHSKNGMDYAFLNEETLEITSYSENAKKFVQHSMRDTGINEYQLNKTIRTLNEAAEKTNKKSKKKRKPAKESQTGVFGTEVGLPIDKENCESTDISGVNTPSGTLNKKKKEIEEEDSILCPECGSKDVIVVGDDTFHCYACDNEWVDTDLDGDEDDEPEVDMAVNNDNDEKPLSNPLEKKARKVITLEGRKKELKSSDIISSGRYEVGKTYKGDDGFKCKVVSINGDATIEIIDLDDGVHYLAEYTELDELNLEEVSHERR